MAKLNDKQIRAWINSNERFEGKADGNGLYLRYSKNDKNPSWRFRYSFNKKARIVSIGSYPNITLMKAREVARELSAKVTLGYDVAGEIKRKKAEALELIQQEESAIRVKALIDEFYERQIKPKRKNPEKIKWAIDTNIIPILGHKKIEEVKPKDIDSLIQSITDRGAPTVANDALRNLKRIFDYAVRRQLIESNPASAFNISDAGGRENKRDRWLSRDELLVFFHALNKSDLPAQNKITFKLILATGLRKMELCAAKWNEIDLDNAVWHFPAERSKTGDAVDIPLSDPVTNWLAQLKEMACGSEYVLPARGRGSNRLPHISNGTLNYGLTVIRELLPESFTAFSIHDLRRTMRTHLSALGIEPQIAERCLNHRVKGIEGVYNRHDYFDERKAALSQWADLLTALESGSDYNVVPMSKKA
ncbi:MULTISPECIES: tyrosine-type recombinase/integrase [Providencia]|uniref:tyrosine-type recombinase/integrase n=1 Tax=Providencia TaxID=586 RepID=UPI0018C78004|nr:MULTISPECIES: site-specific integrase [Providencia]MBG5891043.1 tyrosine-type recombinase/integrase [Providencia rettgeri]WOB89319.1 tyrosine-type recombinase/integrase [Providencia sp. PROV175]